MDVLGTGSPLRGLESGAAGADEEGEQDDDDGEDED